MNKTLAKVLKLVFTIFILLIIAYVGVVLVTTAYEYGYRVFTESAVDSGKGKDVLVQIREGMSDLDIGTELEEKGLVRNAHLFAVQMKLSAYEGKLEPGVYTLKTSMTPKEMIVSMVQEQMERKKATESTENTENSKKENTPGEEEGTAPSKEEQE